MKPNAVDTKAVRTAEFAGVSLYPRKDKAYHRQRTVSILILIAWAFMATVGPTVALNVRSYVFSLFGHTTNLSPEAEEIHTLAFFLALSNTPVVVGILLSALIYGIPTRVKWPWHGFVLLATMSAWLVLLGHLFGFY